MRSLALIFAAIFLVEFVFSNPPNFDYDFSGFTKKRQLLITDCNDIEGQVRKSHDFNTVKLGYNKHPVIMYRFDRSVAVLYSQVGCIFRFENG